MSAELSSTPKLPPIYWFMSMAMVSPVALNILLPALPTVAQALNLSDDQVQLSLTLYLLTLAFGQLICGSLADRFGRRPVLLCGIAVHILGCLLGALAQDLSSLLLARVLQAAGGCTGMVLARTIMLDCHSRERAAGKIAYITLAIALAQALAPTLGGQLTEVIGWQSLFYVSLTLGSLSWLIVLTIIPETLSERADSIALTALYRRYRALFSNLEYLRYCAATSAIACVFYLFLGTAPFTVADTLGGSAADFGNWFLAVALGFMAGSYCAAQLSARAGSQPMIAAGNALGLIALLTLGVIVVSGALSLPSLFLPMALFTFGRGLSQPNNQSAAIAASAGAAGTASGLLGFVQLALGAVVVQSAGILLALGLEAVVAAMLLFTALAIAASSAKR